MLLLLETFNKEDIFFSSCWSKHFLRPVTRHKKPYINAQDFSVSFFFSPNIHQSCHLDGCQAIIAMIPLNKSILIMIFTIIMPHFYLLLCHKPIRDIVQQPWAFPHYLTTHFVCLKVIRDLAQLP